MSKSNNNTIIHISGAPGSGKTTIGKELKGKINSDIPVIDLDDLFDIFMAENEFKFDSKLYQEYIDRTIAQSSKPLIFVGLNMDMGHTKTLYNIHPTHKYYIDIPLDIHLKRLFLRDLTGWLRWMNSRDPDILFDQLKTDENKVIDDLCFSLDRSLSLSKATKAIQMFNKTYEKEGYEFKDSDTIIKNVIDLLK